MRELLRTVTADRRRLPVPWSLPGNQQRRGLVRLAPVTPNVTGEAPTAIESFDIFDTLLLRTVGDPAAVHLLVGNQANRLGLTRLEPSRYRTARIEAERRSRRRLRGTETTLEDIHRELADAQTWDARTAEEFRQLELDTEARVLRPHPCASNWLRQVRAAGGEVIFVSDMYLPEGFVREQLRCHGLLQAPDRLYVSNACNGHKKASGALFEHVLETEDAHRRRLHHTGNDLRADVIAPRRLGIAATHESDGNPTRYESTLESWSAATGALSSLLAGASRLARLSVPVSSPHERTIIEVAAGVAGPMLVAYSIWLLRQAQRDGIERLYFLARDGQALMEVAAGVRDRLGLDTELRYLHVSRQALNIALVGSGDRDDVVWALTHAASNTVRTVLERVGLDPTVCRDELEELGLPTSRWDEPAGPEVVDRLVDEITHGILRKAASQGSNAASALVHRYLEEHGFFDHISVAVVDSTGSGSQVRTLARLREGRNLSASPGYLMVRRAPGPPIGDSSAVPVRGWFEDEVRRLGYGQPGGRATLLEVFCAADHGTTLGYRDDGDHVIPRLSESAVAQMQWGLPMVRRALASFVRTLDLDEELADLDADLREPIGHLLDLLWREPTVEEARAWGTFPFEATSGGESLMPLAPPYRAGEVLAAVRRGAVRSRGWSDWPAASTRRSRPWARGVLAIGRTLKIWARRAGLKARRQRG